MSSCEKLPPLPPGVKPLSHQVAGHVYGHSKSKLGFLEAEDGTIMKPVQSPPRGPRELTFYQTVFNPTCTDPVLQELRPLLPTYLGTCSLAEQPGVTYFQLEDITRQFLRPCIMDVKIGPITWDPDADQDKIDSEKRKYPPVEKTGFQIIGMKLSNPDGTYNSIHRDYLRSLDAEELLHKGLGVFFKQNGTLRQDVIQSVIARISSVEKWFLTQREYAFYASSLLIVYDAASREQHQKDNRVKNEVLTKQPLAGATGTTMDSSTNFISGDDAQNCAINTTQDSSDINTTHDAITTDTLLMHQSPSEIVSSIVSSSYHCDVHGMEKGFDSNRIDIRMIDFAHVFPSQEADENYLKGLRGLKIYLNKLLHS